jgi:hypothetical protein
MASYLFLQAAYIGDRYYDAGGIYATGDAGGTLPADWKPNPNVDPIDSAAIDAFYNCGPRQQDLVCSTYVDNGVRPPCVYWRQLPGSPVRWELVGSNKPPVSV